MRDRRKGRGREEGERRVKSHTVVTQGDNLIPELWIPRKCVPSGQHRWSSSSSTSLISAPSLFLFLPCIFPILSRELSYAFKNGHCNLSSILAFALEAFSECLLSQNAESRCPSDFVFVIFIHVYIWKSTQILIATLWISKWAQNITNSRSRDNTTSIIEASAYPLTIPMPIPSRVTTMLTSNTIW